MGVHNLAFDFQFIRKLFTWTRVFSTKPRNPIKADAKIGIEFRDTLILSGYSLAKTGEHLQKHKVKKRVGDLDYTLLRHSKTPLSEDRELPYLVNDVLVVSSFIEERSERAGSITRLPLTKTGYIRKYLRDACMFEKSSHKRDVGKKFNRYYNYIQRMKITSLEEYLLLNQCYTGAIVHANLFRSNRIIENVHSQDETSAYPAQMVLSDRFPVSSGTKVRIASKSQFDLYISKYACLIDAEFIGIRKTNTFESIISVSKCLEIENPEEDNGRLISADKIHLVFNDVDYEIFSKFYEWKTLRIKNFYIYRRGRLPTDFVNAILDLYEKKTTLKGVEGMEAEYLESKENINSAYGASVTDICKNEAVYTEEGDWIIEAKDFWTQIKTYNLSKGRFLFYPWGIWVTSLARRALASAILSLGNDYIYSDTDSVKYTNFERHEDYFRKYNSYIERSIEKASAYHHIPVSKFMPKTIKGEVKVIGVWDYEGNFRRFKTLGAKRYAVEYPDGTHSLTIAGVNKKVAVPYVEAHEKDFFDCMKFGYVFNAEACGKNLHTYIDEERHGVMIDYMGNACEFASPSSVHLEETTYEMSTTDDYEKLLKGVFDFLLGID